MQQSVSNHVNLAVTLCLSFHLSFSLLAYDFLLSHSLFLLHEYMGLVPYLHNLHCTNPRADAQTLCNLMISACILRNSQCLSFPFKDLCSWHFTIVCFVAHYQCNVIKAFCQCCDIQTSVRLMQCVMCVNCSVQVHVMANTAVGKVELK